MHKAYLDSEQNDNTKNNHGHNDNEKGKSDDEEDAKNKQTNEKDYWGGHLKNRLFQFDARTERMKEEWYLAFSEVRQGSFLTKNRNQENREWEKMRKENNLGRGAKRHRLSWCVYKFLLFLFILTL